MNYTLDNRNGKGIIYWISNTTQYGTTGAGQIVEGGGEFAGYTDRKDWISDMSSLGIYFEDFLYFDTALERDAFNIAESVYNGGGNSKGWYSVGENEEGYYVDLSTNTENNSLWNRFKNWFR
jgi:hypothetical protein